MTTAQAESDRYAAISQRLIGQAEEELQKGDCLQAGEKVWGAVAHAVKAVAEQRGWVHHNHRRLHDIADQIADERARPDLRLLFAASNIMHDNFHEDFLDADRVEQGVKDASLLMRELEAIRVEPPLPFTVESRAQERRVARLTAKSV